MSGLAISSIRTAPMFQEGCGLHPQMIEELPKVIAIALVVLPALAAALATWFVSTSLLHTLYAGGVTLGVMSTVAFTFAISLKSY